MENNTKTNNQPFRNFFIKLTVFPSIFVALVSLFASQNFDVPHIALFLIFIINMICIYSIVLRKKIKRGFWIFCFLTLCGSVINYHLYDVAWPFLLFYLLAPFAAFLILKFGKNNIWGQLK